MEKRENIKRDQILNNGRALFWKHGYRRVSVEEICQAAGVSKMTYYKHFRNKLHLVKAVIEGIQENALVKYRAIMNQDIPFLEKVKQTIQLKMDQTNALNRDFFDDLHRHADPELVAFFNQKMQESIRMVMDDYTSAQKRGDVRPDIKPEFIVYFLNQMMDFAKDERLVQHYESPQALIMELVRFFFYGILPRDGNGNGIAKE